jgi:hypothetical protein
MVDGDQRNEGKKENLHHPPDPDIFSKKCRFEETLFLNCIHFSLPA